LERLRREFAVTRILWIGAVLGAIFLPHDEFRATVAVAAGSLFEAAPLLLFATALPPRLRAGAGALGCGCGGGGLPGALAPVAIATCWFAFGPLVTAARVAGALAASGALRSGVAAFVARKRGAAKGLRFEAAPGHEGDGCSASERMARARIAQEGTEGPEPFGELAAIGACSAAAAPVAALAVHGSGPLQFALGLVLGVLAPCATAGVALAAGAAHHAPGLAAAILATSGIAPWREHLRARWAFLRRHADAALPLRASIAAIRPSPAAVMTSRRGSSEPRVALRAEADTGTGTGTGTGIESESESNSDGRFASGLLVIALVALCWRGPAGLVNPRLVALAGAGALCAARYAWRRPRAPAGAWLVPGVMLLALAMGSPAPSYAANETTAAGGFAGESADFSGASFGTSGNRPPRLIRFAITCCRLDAEAVELPLDRALPVRAGSWVAAHGRLAERSGSLILQVESWHAIRPPADPFVYR